MDRLFFVVMLRKTCLVKYLILAQTMLTSLLENRYKPSPAVISFKRIRFQLGSDGLSGQLIVSTHLQLWSRMSSGDSFTSARIRAAIKILTAPRTPEHSL